MTQGSFVRFLGLTSVLLAGACHDSSHAPRARPAAGSTEEPAGSMLGPVDLVYICGNRFLATNSTNREVHVEYRVVGTRESGSLTLDQGLNEDPWHSETELETRERGVVELYLDGERVARRRNERTPCGAEAMSASVASITEAGAGSWGPVVSWPTVPMHLSLLPDGKVLGWGRAAAIPQIWDPTTESFTSAPISTWIFCSGHALLPDGRLLVVGGHIKDDHGLADISLFDPTTGAWSRSPPMKRGRWYPTAVTLGNGNVLILAGRDQAGVAVRIPEIWSSGFLTPLTTAALTLPYYPRVFLAPNGKVFLAGEHQMSRYLDVAGSRLWNDVGNRLYGGRGYGAAVMYDDGKILYVGGGRTTNTAEIIDLNQAAPVWQWTGSMAFPRRHLNATVLPTGEVLVTGGTSGTTFNDVSRAVQAAELWNPTTGTWTILASSAARRTYHSTSILLPDGRVLHGGSGASGAPYEYSAETFSPPYLSEGPRPTIAEAPSTVEYGSSFAVSTPEALEIARVSLIRLGSTTHAFDMNQRFQWLPFTAEEGALIISAPSSRNRAPPGHYMLFLLNGAGVPSVAKIIRLDGRADPPPPQVIQLSVTGRSDATKQYLTLRWSGARGGTVDLYRNRRFLRNTVNDGVAVTTRTYVGPATYVLKVCEAGSTICSNEVTFVFR